MHYVFGNSCLLFIFLKIYLYLMAHNPANNVWPDVKILSCGQRRATTIPYYSFIDHLTDVKIYYVKCFIDGEGIINFVDNLFRK